MRSSIATGCFKHVSFLEDLAQSEAEDESDIRFIQEVVATYQRDLEEQLNTHDMVQKALLCQVETSKDAKDEILSGLRAQHDNYHKILTYASFLIDQLQATKNQLRDESK